MAYFSSHLLGLTNQTPLSSIISRLCDSPYNKLLLTSLTSIAQMTNTLTKLFNLMNKKKCITYYHILATRTHLRHRAREKPMLAGKKCSGAGRISEHRCLGTRHAGDRKYGVHISDTHIITWREPVPLL